MIRPVLGRAARAAGVAAQRADLRLLEEIEEAMAENRRLNALLEAQVADLEQSLLPHRD